MKKLIAAILMMNVVACAHAPTNKKELVSGWVRNGNILVYVMQDGSKIGCHIGGTVVCTDEEGNTVEQPRF